MERKPIKYVLTYLFFSLIVYVATYVKTDSYNMLLTILVCSIYFSFFGLGYYSISFKTVKKRSYGSNFEYSRGIGRIVLVAAVATAVVSLVNVFSFYSSIQMIMEYITNPGKAYEYVKYVNRNNIENSGMILISSSLVGIILTTLSFSKFIVLIFIPLYWKCLSKTVRIVGTLSLVMYIIQAFLIGAMINIGIILFSCFPIVIFMGGKNRDSKPTTGKGKWSVALLLVGAVVLIVYFMGTRFVPINASIGEILLAGISGLGVYISHGYVGLSKCLDLSFIPTFGATTFHGLARTFLPSDLYNALWENSYLYRNQVESGWQALQVWSTIFPWLASDISFLLIPFVMLLVGRFMGRVWKEAITRRNPYAFVMMGQLMIFSFMIPANNQLFHSYGNSASVILIYFMYRLSIAKKKCYIRVRVAK